MKILITGANGFLGKNLAAALGCIKNGTDYANSDVKIDELYLYGRDDGFDTLKTFCADCDFIFHFAGVNRAVSREEFFDGNAGFAKDLTAVLTEVHNNCPIVFASSEKAEMPDTDYGKSKREAEEILISYSHNSGANLMIYRLPHIFGKWCRENYNSVVATFCYNTARLLPIDIIEPQKKISLTYIDDFVTEMLSALRKKGQADTIFYEVSPVYHVTVGEIANTVFIFSESSRTLKNLSDFSSGFEKKLFSTYLSYIPPESVAVPIVSSTDARGSFTELLRGNLSGQVSINVVNPGCSKGGHWHNSKCEIFIPLCGEGIVRQRKIGDDKIYETKIDSASRSAVYILPGYTHSIVNPSRERELSVLIWANEEYDPSNTDTYKEDV